MAGKMSKEKEALKSKLLKMEDYISGWITLSPEEKVLLEEMSKAGEIVAFELPIKEGRNVYADDKNLKMQWGMEETAALPDVIAKRSRNDIGDKIIHMTEDEAKEILGDVYRPPVPPRMLTPEESKPKTRRKQKRKEEAKNPEKGLLTKDELPPDVPVGDKKEETKILLTIERIKSVLERGYKDAMIKIGNIVIDEGYLAIPKEGDVWKDWGKKASYRSLVQHEQFPMTTTGLWNCVTVAKMLKFLEVVEGGIDTDHLSFSHLLLIASQIKGPAAKKQQVKIIKALKDNPMSVAQLEAKLKPVKLVGGSTNQELQAFKYVENVANAFSEELIASLVALDTKKLIAYTGSNSESDLLLHLDVYTNRLHRALEGIQAIRKKLESVPMSEQEG